MDEKDIWRAAQAYVSLHGADAVIQAAIKADELLAKGDLLGAATWRQVIKAIESLENTEPGSVL